MVIKRKFDSFQTRKDIFCKRQAKIQYQMTYNLIFSDFIKTFILSV